MLDKIYDALLQDKYIKQHCDGRIKYYEYPETKTLDAPHIIIDPIDVPIPSDYADNIWLTDVFLYQIDVWSNDLQVTQTLANKVRMVLWSLNFRQRKGIDEWDKDYNIFRDARQYEGKAYNKNIEE